MSALYLIALPCLIAHTAGWAIGMSLHSSWVIKMLYFLVPVWTLHLHSKREVDPSQMEYRKLFLNSVSIGFLTGLFLSQGHWLYLLKVICIGYVYHKESHWNTFASWKPYSLLFRLLSLLVGLLFGLKLGFDIAPVSGEYLLIAIFSIFLFHLNMQLPHTVSKTSAFFIYLNFFAFGSVSGFLFARSDYSFWFFMSF